MFIASRRVSLAVGIASLLIATRTSAAPLIWNPDGSSGSLGWNTTALSWSNGVSNQAWSNAANDTAVFGGASGLTVVVETPIIVGGLTFDTADYVISGQEVHLGTPGQNTITLNANAAIHSEISGDSSALLTISGPGTLTLTGANTYVGSTTVAGATVIVNNFGDGNSGNLGAAGPITLSGGTLVYTGGSASAARDVVGYGPLGGGTIDIPQNGTVLTLNGKFNGQATRNMIKSGEGTLRFEGVTDNGGGRIIVNAGVLVLAKTSASNVHAIGSGGNTDHALVLNNGVVRLDGTGDDQIYANSSVVLENGTFDMNGRNEGFSQLSGLGGVLLNDAAGTTSTLTLGENNGSSTFDGVLKNGAGALALTKTGTGTVTLTGANSYSGGTVINGGALNAATTSSLPGYATPGSVTVNNGGVVAVRVGGLNGWQPADIATLRANAVFNAGAGLGIDTTNGDYTYGEALSGNFSFLKLGDNLLLLTGNNSHTAGTRVLGGTLKLGSATAFGTGPATITSGTLDVNGFSITTPMLSSTLGELTNTATTDATVTVNLGANTPGSFGGTISTPNTGKLHLVINASGTGPSSNYSLNSFNTFVGSVTMNGVGLTTGTTGLIGVPQSGGLGDPANVLTLNNGGGLTNMYNPAATGSWPNFGAPTLDNPIVLTGAVGGVVRVGYGTTGGRISLAGVISGPGALTKTDGGLLELTGNNTYEGSTTIAGGTLSLGNGGTSGSLPSTSVLNFGTANSTRLTFNRAGEITFPNEIIKGGRANITVSAADQTVTLTGKISGTTEFWLTGPGTLVVQPNANTSGSGSIVLNSGAILEISDFSPQTLGSGNIFLGQGGTEATLRYTGPTTTTGRLTGGVFQGTGSTIEVTGPDTTLTLTGTLNNTAPGVGRTIKEGPGTLVFTGANNYVGGTIVAEGRLFANNTSGSATGVGPLAVLEGAVLGGTGTIAPTGENGLDLQGIVAPGVNIGTLTIGLGSTTGGITLTNTASFRFELGVSGTLDFPGVSDRLTLLDAGTADFTFANNVIDFGGTGEAGWYRLFGTSLDSTTWSGLTMNASNVIVGGLSVANLAPGLVGELVLGNGTVGTEGQIYLHTVPEPTSAALLMGAAVGLLSRRRRR